VIWEQLGQVGELRAYIPSATRSHTFRTLERNLTGKTKPIEQLKDKKHSHRRLERGLVIRLPNSAISAASMMSVIMQPAMPKAMYLFRVKR
jgi:hypothetical protein